MKEYVVKALSVGGRGKKIYNSGDIVTDGNFLPGRAEELVKQGFLTPLVKAESNPEPVEEIQPEPELEAPSIMEGIKDSLPEEEKQDAGIDSITRKEIMKVLAERGLEFNSNASKKDLYALWLNHKS